MKTISIHDAKTNLSKYIAAAKRGETVAIGAYGKPEVWLSTKPMTDDSTKLLERRFGQLRGKLTVPDNFDEPDTELLSVVEEDTIV